MLSSKIDKKDISLLYQSLPQNPIGIIKYLLRHSRSVGSNSFSYHVAPAFVSNNNGFSRSFFCDKKSLTSKIADPKVYNIVKKTHDCIISSGRPTTYLKLMESNVEKHSKYIQQIEADIKEIGIVDEYIIPVYGPYKIEGCICYGFDKKISDIDTYVIDGLHRISLMAHNLIIPYYQDKIAKVKLSRREIEVLNWMSLGKSKYDIAVISGLKPPTVETYTRRIYKKFGVNSKLAAVIAAIATNNLKY